MAPADAFPGRDYDLITGFGCLGYLADPVGAATHMHQALKPDGTLMILEPFAHPTLAENLNVSGQLFYGISAMLSVPTTLDQGAGQALGSQAGAAPFQDILTQAGFTRVRTVEDEFYGSMMLEARP